MMIEIEMVCEPMDMGCDNQAATDISMDSVFIKWLNTSNTLEASPTNQLEYIINKLEHNPCFGSRENVTSTLVIVFLQATKIFYNLIDIIFFPSRTHKNSLFILNNIHIYM